MQDAEDPDRVALGRAIAARRVTLGMKRKDLAEAAGLSYPYIAEIENGGKSPSQRALMAIAEALKLQPSDLLLTSEHLVEAPQAFMELATPSRSRDSRAARGLAYVPEDPAARIIEEMREELRLLSRRVARLDDEVRELRALLNEGDG